MVKTVNATAGSIGYAALPDAKANGATTILALQNNGQKIEGATYGEAEAKVRWPTARRRPTKFRSNARNGPWLDWPQRRLVGGLRWQPGYRRHHLPDLHADL